MGAVEVVHFYEHYDWQKGLYNLQKKADEVYGRHEGYSGEINCIYDFNFHTPKTPLKSEEEVDDYISNRFENIVKRSGEVIKLSQVGFCILKPEVKEYMGGIPLNSTIFRGAKEPAILLDRDGKVIKRGTLAELKVYGKELIMKFKGMRDYYIVSRSTVKVFKVTMAEKMVRSTTRQSTDGQLVLPVYRFVAYGMAPS